MKAKADSETELKTDPGRRGRSWGKREPAAGRRGRGLGDTWGLLCSQEPCPGVLGMFASFKRAFTGLVPNNRLELPGGCACNSRSCH